MAFDYSGLFPQMQQNAQRVPGVTNAQRDLPQVGSEILNSSAKQEAMQIIQSRGKALSQNASSVGLDPDLVQMVYDTDPVKGIDMYIQAVERQNMQNAEEFVGGQLQDDYDWDGDPAGTGYGKWNQQRQADIRSSAEGSQNPYVRKAWESRLAKMEKAGIDYKERVATQGQALRNQSAMNKLFEDIAAKYGVADYVENQGEVANIKEGMAQIVKDADAAEAGTGRTQKVGIYAMGSLDKALQENAWADTLRQVYTQASLRGEKSVMERAQDALNSLLNRDGTGEQKAQSLMTEFDRKSEAVNSGLRGLLMMGIFRRIHALTGAAMSESERASYLSAFGAGDSQGVNAVIDQYDRNIAAINERIRRAKQELVEGKALDNYMWSTADGEQGEKIRERFANMQEIKSIMTPELRSWLTARLTMGSNSSDSPPPGKPKTEDVAQKPKARTDAGKPATGGDWSDIASAAGL